MWAAPAGALTEFETEKNVGLDEYETRTAGWRHVPSGRGVLLTLQQDWGEKDAPDHRVPSGA